MEYYFVHLITISSVLQVHLAKKDSSDVFWPAIFAFFVTHN